MADTERLLRESVDAAMQWHPRQPELACQSLGSLAVLLAGQRRHGEGEQALTQAMQWLEQYRLLGSRTHASLLHSVAVARVAQGNLEAAAAIVQHAMQLLSPTGQPDPVQSLVGLLSLTLARIRLLQGRYGECSSLLDQADRSIAQASAPAPDDLAGLWLTRAQLLVLQGQYAQAEPFVHQTLNVLRGRPRRKRVQAMVLQGDVAAGMGRHHEAEARWQEALEEMRDTPEQQDLRATVTNNLGFAALRQQRFGEAEALFRRSLDLAHATRGRNDPEIATTLNNIAVACREQGKLDEAEPLQRHALEMQEKTLGPEHSSIVNTLKNLALIHQCRGRLQEAQETFQRALSIAQRGLGVDHPKYKEIEAHHQELQRRISAGDTGAPRR